MADTKPAPAELTPAHVSAHLEAAMEILSDRGMTMDDRGIAYAVLHQVQLRINRELRANRDELITHIVANDLRSLGPLTIRTSAIDPAWPCNDEGNWDDAGVQDQLGLFAKIAPEYFRHVPPHIEVIPAVLGADYAAGDPVARRLFTELKGLGYRTEEGRRLSLSVREPFRSPSA